MEWAGVGHKNQKEYFERLLGNGRLSHAYLLAGPEGVGKRTMVEDVVAVLVPHGYMMDVMRLAPTKDEETGKLKDIPIEAVKSLKSWISLRPAGAHKAVIIDDADRLGAEAANTLLKVLEEPPAYARFFLISGRPGEVMATIASRCERMDFSPLDESDMQKVLTGRKMDADDRALLASIASGRPGTAIELLESGRLSDVAAAIAGLETILRAGIAERLTFAKKLADQENAPEIVGWWLSYTHSRLEQRPQFTALAHGLLDLAGVLAESHYNRRLAIESFLLGQSLHK